MIVDENSKIDRHRYRGWLNSDSFIKRSVAVFGYSLVGYFVVAATAIVIFGLLALLFAAAFK